MSMNVRYHRFVLSCFCGLVLTAGLCAQQPAPPTQTPSPEAAQKRTAPQPPAASPQETAPPAKEAALPPTNDPKEIVRRSMEIDHRNWEKARNYTCQQREVIQHLGKHGKVKSSETRTFDVNFYYGEEYSRLIAVDDKPLSAKEQKKEDDKLEKFLAKLRKESEENREKRLAKEKKQREEGRAFLRDVVNAYDFQIVGNETVDGMDTWVIEATPRKDFHPTQPHAGILSKIKGKLWIDKKEYNWVKVEAEATDTISYGLFLVRIHPGSRFSFEQQHLNHEVWLTRRFNLDGSARVALLKNERLHQEDVFSNYKKYVTSVRILPVRDAQPKAPAK
jgi:hypothetical protein